MTGIITYPVIVTIGSAALVWLIGETRKSNRRFQKFILQELKHEWRLVQADVYPIEIYASRLEELGEFMIVDEESQSLLTQILKATTG